MGPFVIIGASEFGREVCTYAEACGLRVKDFLDSRAEILDGFCGRPSLLASPETYRMAEGDVFVSAMGDPVKKLEYAEMLGPWLESYSIGRLWRKNVIKGGMTNG